VSLVVKTAPTAALARTHLRQLPLVHPHKRLGVLLTSQVGLGRPPVL